MDTYEPWHDKSNKVSVHTAKDQPGHPPSLIRVFAVRLKKPWVLSYPLSAQRRPWSDWADAQVDPSLHWAHTQFVGFVMRQLILSPVTVYKCSIYMYVPVWGSRMHLECMMAKKWKLRWYCHISWSSCVSILSCQMVSVTYIVSI